MCQGELAEYEIAVGAVALIPMVGGVVPGAVNVEVLAVERDEVPGMVDGRAGDDCAGDPGLEAQIAESLRVALTHRASDDQRVVCVVA